MAAKPHVSRAFQSPHFSSRGGAGIDHIVIHYTTSRNIDGTIQHFMAPASKVSAHYVIGQDGELVQMVPDDKAAWHAGNSLINQRSIGIEHVAAAGDKITPAQEATSAELIRWLVFEHDIPAEHIIPHVSVKSTSCPGDLFAAYGGKAGADKATQADALRRWLLARVFRETAPAQQTEVAVTDEPMPIATPAPRPEAQPASSSLTIWGAIISALSMAAPVLSSKWQLPITPEIVTGVAGIVMTIIGRANTSPLKLR